MRAVEHRTTTEAKALAREAVREGRATVLAAEVKHIKVMAKGVVLEAMAQEVVMAIMAQGLALVAMAQEVVPEALAQEAAPAAIVQEAVLEVTAQKAVPADMAESAVAECMGAEGKEAPATAQVRAMNTAKALSGQKRRWKNGCGITPNSPIPNHSCNVKNRPINWAA